MSLSNTNQEKNDIFDQLLEEASQGLKEINEASRMGNIPRLAAALCHLELHVSSAIKLLEEKYPFFKACDFREIIAQKHHEVL